MQDILEEIKRFIRERRHRIILDIVKTVAPISGLSPTIYLTATQPVAQSLEIPEAEEGIAV